MSWGTNEALVDNWKPMAIVVRKKSELNDAIGLATHFVGIPVVDLDKNTLWKANISPLNSVGNI
jgi:hypothetical protein